MIRSLKILSFFIITTWLSLIVIFYVVEGIFFKTLTMSWLRSLLGLMIYVAWGIAWYACLMRLASHYTRQPLSARG